MKKINWPKIDSDHLIVYSKQMSELESEIFTLGMPEESLMEKVGIEISNWLFERENLLKNGVVIFIGPGHNGGDGAVIARELFLKEIPVKVWCPFKVKKKLTLNHLNYITSIGVEKLPKPPNPKGNELWIDAILGNNQKREVDEKLINLFNLKFEENNGKIICLDLPTGLCPDTGKPFSKQAVKADTTLSVGLKKIGILQDTALPFVGKIHNIEIGFTQDQLSKVPRKLLSLSARDISTLKISLPNKNTSKYERGKTLLIVGSNKYPGAAYLAIKGAIASGVGLTKTLVPEIVAKSLWHESPEVIVEGSLEQSLEKNSLIHSALNNTDLNKFDSIVIGPGLGMDVIDWEKSVETLLKFKGLLILDADALNRIARSELKEGFFLKRKFKTWITPHFKEFERLFPNNNGSNHIEKALDAAKNFHFNILLKGAHSVIADSDGNAWQLYDTDSLSARAGLGDLLSGFLSGISAIEIASVKDKDISPEALAKYALLHSFSAYKCEEGSNAFIIGKELSRIMRDIKLRQML